MDHVVFLILGVGNGAVFAAMALALVVTYRSSGVVNFATGAIALYVAYTYAFLRKGQVLNPIPGMDKTFDLGFKPGLAGSMIIALALAAVMGALLFLLVFRPLRSAPAVAKAVASIGLTVVIQSLLAEKVGTTPVNTPHFLPKGSVRIHSTNVNREYLYLAAIIVLVTLALWLWFRFTRFGLATRAAAETEKGALVTGLSPDRLAIVNWSISTMVAGLSGILISPIAAIIPVSYTLYVVPALAAALVGGFTSLPIAVAAGFAIGAINSELVHLQATHDWTWLTAEAAAALVPLALILGYLVVRGRPLPSRGALILQTLGRAPAPRSYTTFAGGAVAGAVIGTVALLGTSGNYRFAVMTTMIYAVIALSLVVVTGFAGQVSLAQLTLAGAGAFALSRFTLIDHVPFPFAPLLAAAVAMVIGVVVGLPALRIRGLPVAVVTLALAVFLDSFWFKNPRFTNQNDTTVKNPRAFGHSLGVSEPGHLNRVQFGFLCLVTLIIVALGVAWLRRSRLGAAMLAVRANERSAAAAGIDVARTKVIAFAIGAYIAGIGGCLLAYEQTRANEGTFNPIVGLGFFASVYLAGITSLSGGVIAGVIAAGGIFYTFLTKHITGLGLWYDVATGILLIFTVIQNPEGIAFGFHAFADKLHAKRKAAAPPPERPEAAPVPVAPTAVTAGPTLLSLRHVGVRYGGVVAVDDVSLEVPEGLIVGLIGPNGAGKTTLIDAISGYAPASGEVTFAGQQLDGLKPYKRIRTGLGRTFQGIELYEDLTVTENIVVGQEAARHGGDHVGRWASSDSGSLQALFDLLGLSDVADRPARELSQGQRQLVSVARALAGRPRLVLLDEPAGGLDSTESQWLGDRLRNVRDAGVSVVMIDHDMQLVLTVCDYIHVLDLGRVIASGTPSEIKTNPAVTAAYLGDTHAKETVS